jgi:hypothetical protein
MTTQKPIRTNYMTSATHMASIDILRLPGNHITSFDVPRLSDIQALHVCIHTDKHTYTYPGEFAGDAGWYYRGDTGSCAYT